MRKGVEKFVENEFNRLKLIFKYLKKKREIILSIETYK